MPRLPDKSALGGTPSMDVNEGVVTGAQYGAGAIAQGAEKLGGDLDKIADENIQRRDALDAAKWEAARRPQYESLVDQFHKDPDYQTFEPRFKAAVADIDNNALGIVQNPVLRERLKYKAAVEADGALRRVLTHGNQLRRQDEFATADDAIGQMLSPLASTDTTPDSAQEMLRQADAHLENLKRTGNLDPAQAHHLQEKHITGTTGMLARGSEDRFYNDPAGLIADLKAARKLRPNELAPQGDLTLDFIKKQEGFAPTAKGDFKQISSGYGTKAGAIGEPITREEAQKRLEAETGKVGDWIGENITVPLNEKQRAALTSFGYNLGTGKGGLSDLTDDINAGNWDKVASRMQTFNRAGGKVNAGLVTRRKDEASLLLAGAKDGVTGNDQGGSASDDTVPEGDREPAGAPSGWAPLYARMSPIVRERMMTRAKVAMAYTLESAGKNAVDQLSRTGQLPTDENGKTILDVANGVMAPNKLRRLEGVINDAKTTYELRAPLSNMTDDQALAHLDQAPPGKAKDAAWSALKKIREERQSDPVAAISGKIIKGVTAPSLRRDENGDLVGHQMDDGEFQTKPARELQQADSYIRAAQDESRKPVGPNGKLFTTLRNDPVAADGYRLEARLEAQRRLGIDNPKLISREEGDNLLKMPKGLFKDQDSKAYTDALKTGADRIYQAFGPKYAKQVFEDAIGFHLSKSDDVSAANRQMAKILAAHATDQKVDRGSLERVQNLQEIDRVGRMFEGQGAINPNQYQTQRTGNMPPIQPDRDTLSGIADYASRKATAAARTPSESDEAWALAKPSRQEEFDKQFGDGAYARALAKRQQQ